MTHVSRLIVLTALIILLLSVTSRAVTFQDSFDTNPYSSGSQRWCERYHHGHWGLTTETILMEPGTYAGNNHSSSDCSWSNLLEERYSCPVPSGLSSVCEACLSAGTTDSACSKVDGITEAVQSNPYGLNVSGEHDRLAQANFKIREHLEASERGEHIAIYNARSEYCEQGMQAALFARVNNFGGDPNQTTYQLLFGPKDRPLLGADLSSPPSGDGHCEIGTSGTNFGDSHTVSTAGTAALVTNTLYHILIETEISGGNLVGSARLCPISGCGTFNGTVWPNALLQINNHNFGLASTWKWYPGAATCDNPATIAAGCARRFLLGVASTSSASDHIPLVEFDDFASAVGC